MLVGGASLECENEVREQQGSRERGSQTYARCSSFVLGVMVGMIGLAAVQQTMAGGTGSLFFARFMVAGVNKGPRPASGLAAAANKPGLNAGMLSATRMRPTARVPGAAMNVAALRGSNEDPEFSKGVVFPTRRWTNEIWHTSLLVRQTYPPVKNYGMNTRALLNKWVDLLVDPFVEHVGGVFPTRLAKKPSAEDELPPSLEIKVKYWQHDNAKVLHNMRDAVSKATKTYTDLDTPIEDAVEHVADAIEAVALLPEDLEKPFLESGSSAAEASVMALSVFRRATARDDSKGSLLKKFEEQFGKEGKEKAGGLLGRREKNFDVFEIEGVVQAPGVPARPARVLLAKIAKYAQEEQKLVVVPMRAYISKDGTDLTDYYLSLGFEKVEMDDGAHQFQLVFTGHATTPEDKFVESHEVMVGMNLWTGI